jgi:hypothetical protein
LRGGRYTVSGVDGRDDGEVVLEFEEMVDGCGQGSVERVEERWVEGTEGKFVDDVRELNAVRSTSISQCFHSA